MGWCQLTLSMLIIIMVILPTARSSWTCSNSDVKPVQNVLTLDLSEKGITRIDNNTLLRCTSVTTKFKVIDFRGGSVTSIGPDAFNITSILNSSRIQYLYLDGNHIESLEPYAFRGLKFYDLDGDDDPFIGLSNNKLSKIQVRKPCDS